MESLLLATYELDLYQSHHQHHLMALDQTKSLPLELEDSGEKRVIRSEHHRRADEKCIGERRADRQFAFAALSDI